MFNTLNKTFIGICLAAISIASLAFYSFIQENKNPPVEYVNSNFENASPLFWENQPDGTAMIHILYDHERNTPNRASNHVLFQVHAKTGSEVVLKIQFFDEIWNGKRVASQSLVKNYHISADGKVWKIIPAELIEKGHKVKIHMDSDKVFVAGMEPYRISDLEKLKKEIIGNPLVDIQQIGKTIEGRDLEIIRIGKKDAKFSVFIRARAHPWEAGGNWVVQGLIRNLLESKNKDRRYLEKFCVYILPMANKDGVAHGYTRFNSLGMDLNRGMNRPADPTLSPENVALESWMKEMTDKGMKPDIVMDLHNDRNGKLAFGNPSKVNSAEYNSAKVTASLQDSYTVLSHGVDLEKFQSNAKRFETLMYNHTWYTWTENGVKKDSSNSGSYNVPAYDVDISCLLELNQTWIEGLKKVPAGKDWELMGKELCDVFYYYFE